MGLGLTNQFSKIQMLWKTFRPHQAAVQSFALVHQRILLSVSPQKMTIKHFSIEYDAINNKNTFTNGDTINGRIIVEASKETEIKSIIFTGQGRAEVYWSEHYGGSNDAYWAVEKYYNVKHHILRGTRQDGKILTKHTKYIIR